MMKPVEWLKSVLWITEYEPIVLLNRLAAVLCGMLDSNDFKINLIKIRVRSLYR
jgi:hypothetical protein